MWTKVQRRSDVTPRSTRQLLISARDFYPLISSLFHSPLTETAAHTLSVIPTSTSQNTLHQYPNFLSPSYPPPLPLILENHPKLFVTSSKSFNPSFFPFLINDRWILRCGERVEGLEFKTFSTLITKSKPIQLISNLYKYLCNFIYNNRFKYITRYIYLNLNCLCVYNCWSKKNNILTKIDPEHKI